MKDPNTHVSNIVKGLESQGFVLMGCGEYELLSEGATLKMESDYTKDGKRYLRGVLHGHRLDQHRIDYLRKVQVIIGKTQRSAYFGRSGGFDIMDIPEGMYPIVFDFNRRREIRTTKERQQALKSFNRKKTKKKYSRNSRERQEQP